MSEIKNYSSQPYVVNNSSSVEGNILNATSNNQQIALTGKEGIKYSSVELQKYLLKIIESKDNFKNGRINLIRRISNSLNPDLLAKYNIQPQSESFINLMDFIDKHIDFIEKNTVVSIDEKGRGTLENFESDTKFYIHFNNDLTVDYEIIKDDNDEGEIKKQKSISDFLSEVQI